MNEAALPACRLCNSAPTRHPRNNRIVYHPPGGCSLGNGSIRLPIKIADWIALHTLDTGSEK